MAGFFLLSAITNTRAMYGKIQILSNSFENVEVFILLYRTIQW